MEDYAVVVSTIGTLKKEPDFKSETVDEALFGMVVKLLKKASDNWYYITTSYDYEGYIHDSQIHICGDEALNWDRNANHMIKFGIIDIMAEPSFQSYQLLELTRGAVVKLSGKTNEKWSEIILPTKTMGWVRTEFIADRIRPQDSKPNEDILRKNIINTALSYLGSQYRWGGKTPYGIDCSGLCSISYLINGIVIYRDAHIKEEFHMRKITREEIKPADLLYWPGHVAMYLGNDKYIHSTGASSSVVINSLNPKDPDFREDLANIQEIGTVF